MKTMQELLNEAEQGAERAHSRASTQWAYTRPTYRAAWQAAALAWEVVLRSVEDEEPYPEILAAAAEAREAEAKAETIQE